MRNATFPLFPLGVRSDDGRLIRVLMLDTAIEYPLPVVQTDRRAAGQIDRIQVEYDDEQGVRVVAYGGISDMIAAEILDGKTYWIGADLDQFVPAVVFREDDSDSLEVDLHVTIRAATVLDKPAAFPGCEIRLGHEPAG